MPQKLSSSISPLDAIFHTTMISSSKTHNSNLHLFLIFSVFLFLVIFLGNITLLLFLNKLHPSCLLFIGVLFVPVWCTLHTSGVAPLIQFYLRRWSLEHFVSSTLLLLLTLSNLFLPVELLRHFLSIPSLLQRTLLF